MTRLGCFEYSLSDPNKTDLVLVSVRDTRTNFVVRTALPNSGKQTASIMAFAGARYSRSALSAEGLFEEIKGASKSANEKLSAIFKNYGHSSVADMAQMFAYIENVPDLYAAKFYYETAVGGGQQRSTRYQDFGSIGTADLDAFLAGAERPSDYAALDRAFQDLQQYSLEKYAHYKEELTRCYTEVYKPDPDSKANASALQARVFDSARYFLLAGANNRTSLAYITSAREWARMISVFKSSADKMLNCLGEQLEALFAPDEKLAAEIGYVPEAPDLIRYTSGDETFASNLRALKTYLREIGFDQLSWVNTTAGYTAPDVHVLDEKLSGGLKAVAQNIATLYPRCSPEALMAWLEGLPVGKKHDLSGLVFLHFDHHRQMTNQYRVNCSTFVVDSSYAEARDLLRHRAWGRFIPMLSIEGNYEAALDFGYTLPLYLTENAKFARVRGEFEQDLNEYYKRLRSFVAMTENVSWFPRNLLLHLLPFGNIAQMWMHASPKEISYMTRLRVRPGGHINYRMLAYDIAERIALQDPFLAALGFEDSKKPSALSREEFFDRS